MVEWVIVGGVVTYITGWVIYARRKKRVAEMQAIQKALDEKRLQIQQKEAEAQSKRTTYKMNIPGTKRFTGEQDFLKGYGINKKNVQEVLVFEDKKLTDKVKRCAMLCYQEGVVRGSEIAKIIANDEEIPSGKALYFICHKDIDAVSEDEPIIYCLVH